MDIIELCENGFEDEGLPSILRNPEAYTQCKAKSGRDQATKVKNYHSAIRLALDNVLSKEKEEELLNRAFDRDEW